MKKPKFRVGQVVATNSPPYWSRSYFRIAEIGKNRSGCLLYSGDSYYDWTGRQLRPLTAREIGPRQKGTGK